MCFVSAELDFGRCFSDELAVTVNLGNVNFPGLKLAPLVTKLLSVFPSTRFPEVGPPAKEFSSLDSVLAVPAPMAVLGWSCEPEPVPVTSQPLLREEGSGALL